MSTVVDSHHHFWDPAHRDYPWMEGLDRLKRRFDPHDLRPLLQHAGVDRTVLVQTVASIAETEEFLETAAATDFVAGVVGWVDLTATRCHDHLARLKSRPDGRYLVGIRHQVHDEHDEGWLLRDDVQRGIKAVGDAGLVYDFLTRTRELPACVETAKRHPEVRFVVDHIAKPEIKSGKLEPWWERLQGFRGMDHVWCKISGMVTEADWDDWRAGDFAPYVERVLELFGEDRVLYGSDWPVCTLAAGYSEVKRAVEKMTAYLSAEAKAKLFGGNAIAVYRLEA